jgi:hypothetical protein
VDAHHTTSLKYVAIVMRADNDGEGGILALMSLLGIKYGERTFVIALGIFGAAMLYGDGAITPAISVLSALEGLKHPLPSFTPYVLPLSVLVLIALFAVQPQGTGRIGALFGPIMMVWFVTIGVLGIGGILQHPGVLAALDPRVGLAYLFGHGFTGFLVLGGVFLCATGAEALYADMGHFGAQPIRLTWYGLVLPTLVLNRDRRHHHPEPIHHIRHFFDDTASHSARSLSAPSYHADVLPGIRPDLCGFRQLDVNGADAGAGPQLPLVRQSRVRLRRCSCVDYALDVDADVSRDARGLGVGSLAKCTGGRPFHHRRSVLRRRQHDEGG